METERIVAQVDCKNVADTVLCKVSLDENGQKANCDITVTELANSPKLTISCVGDPQVLRNVLK
jgi:hypothetical protein